MTNSHSKPLPDRVPIDMTKYPSLQAMGKDAGPIVSGVFATLEDMISSGHHETSEKFFGISIQDLTSELLGAMFDHRGILDSMPNQSNAEMISEAYEHTINPLYAAFDNTDLRDRDFKEISFEEKFGMKKKEFTVKNYIQSLLFYGYYGSLPDIMRYLFTNDHALYDNEKHQNIDKLIEIRPALEYQKAIGILPGKLIPGTGFFAAGELGAYAKCRACKHPDSLFSLGEDDITVCLECKAGYNA